MQWHKGDLPTGADSIATQIAPADHWPEMRIIVLVVNDCRKKYSSTSGMKKTTETSTLIQHRAKNVVDQRIKTITKAILNKDFESFAETTMKDSNQMHAICMDTFPPCVYMNDTSHAIVNLVHSYNEYRKGQKVAYTFDAGPNACIYLLQSEVEQFISVVNYVFPQLAGVEYYRGLSLPNKQLDQVISSFTALFCGKNIDEFPENCGRAKANAL